MGTETNYILVMVLSYLIGSVPSGLIFSTAFGLGDVRRIGSGNIGATNVLRSGHKGAAALTLLADLLKGTFAVLLTRKLFVTELESVSAISVVLGHIFPIWLKFKGGKGVATYLGVTLAIAPVAGIAFVAVWLVAAVIFRYSSLSALLGSAVVPFVVGYDVNVRVAVAFFLMTALVYWRHGANIKRLLSGTESRIEFGDGQRRKQSRS